MEYKDGLMEECIGESTRITRDGERESNKRMEYFTETRLKKASSSAEVKYNEILQS